MKYGERLEDESVPEWSLNNVDYNALKHKIKANTSRNQGDAIAIPGHQHIALDKFEEDLYNDLCVEHHRVGLFVTSKYAEISRRLQYYSSKVNRYCQKADDQCLDEPSKKRQRLASKYDRELVKCIQDLRSLTRFVAAQVKAFNKLLKKYRKWTRSDTLGKTFKQSILSNTSSFSRLDCSQLESECEEVLSKLRAASPPGTAHPSPLEAPAPADMSYYERTQSQSASRPQYQPAQTHYWNEYDDGSEAGDDHAYYIYTDAPNDDEHSSNFTLKSMMGALATPIKELFSPSSPPRGRQPPQRRRLLSSSTLEGYGTNGTDQRTLIASSTDNTDGENDSDDPMTPENGSGNFRFPNGYAAHYATLPSLGDQRARLARERLLARGAVLCFAASVALLLVAGVLFATGRHKLRAEVDGGAAVGIVGSLGFACTALALTMARSHGGGWFETAVVWAVFAGVCVANGMLLVLLMGS